MSPPKKFAFNPKRVAYFEANGWRAYYDRDWFKLLRLIVALCQEQFKIPFPVSLLAAYYVTRASIAWVPVDHDTGIVQGFYGKFYQLARRFSGLQFDPARAAALETKYNDDHRRLVSNPDKAEFIQTMIELHSEIFGLNPDQARPSAKLRVLANNTVDLITGNFSTDIPGDWQRIEEYLGQCYESIAIYLNQ
jgi:hypothetical protein